jgi:hypothetical protein
MDITSTGLGKSVLSTFDEEDRISFKQFKLSKEEILIEFPNLNEEQIDTLQNNILTISEILYNKFK